MAKQPVLSGKELCSILEKEGFECVRQTGSHKIYRKMTEEGITKEFISRAPSPLPSPSGGEGCNITPPLRGGGEGAGDL